LHFITLNVSQAAVLFPGKIKKPQILILQIMAKCGFFNQIKLEK